MLDVVEQRRLHLEVAALARSRARRRSSSTFQITIPFGCQNGEPGERSSRAGTGRAACRAGGGRACAPPRAARGRRPGRPGVEGRAVDPRQLRVVLVAAPVRAGEAGQLERLDRLRVLQVRPAAEVGEVALRVEGDVAVGGVDELDLVRLVLGLETASRLLARDLLARSTRALRRAPAASPPRSARRSSSQIGSGNSKS